jgi:peptide methionine sulfoxide reductase msrA/msrB
MKNSKVITLMFSSYFLFLTFTSCGQNKNRNTENNSLITTEKVMLDSTKWNKLTQDETRVIVNKGTEYAFRGKYVDNHKDGIYQCRRCNSKLFTSDSKFDSGSGWPAFDEVIGNSVEEIEDKDGMRTEIVCANCKGHLGHVFKGEKFTSKNTRHCVNSISLNFIVSDPLGNENSVKTDTAIFASGCFWGTEYFFEKEEGVISTQVGYIGGHVKNPTYKQVCSSTTGHAEAVRVVYDPSKTTYKTLCKLFFETHDPSQKDRQGPDIGNQYRTEVFYLNDNQKDIAQKLKEILEKKGMLVTTEITKSTYFWKAEKYHEHYYSNNGGTPYCHGYTKRFDN